MKSSVINFRDFLNGLDDEEYLINLIAYTIAPTIKGLKAATTVTLCNHDRNLCINWRKNSEIIVKKLNVKACELMETEKAIIVLFYNEEVLLKKLTDVNNRSFLNEYGYSLFNTLEENLCILKERFKVSSFPHELGIFLGFPLLDVKEFIKNPHKKCLFCGYWKVYHDIDVALKTFKYFDEAKYDIANLLCKNKGIINIIAS